VPPASLVFGALVHQALAELLGKKADPVKYFADAWGMLKDIRLGFNQRESWEKLKASGEALLAKFAKEELSKLSEITAVERPFKLAVTSLDLPLVGIIDLVGKVNGKRTVVDWKTAGSAVRRT
jgi:ATP-dependent exoDNAse (exonuclease V) beta subunit